MPDKDQNNGGAAPGVSGTVRANGPDIPSGYALGTGGTLHVSGATIVSGFSGQPSASSFNPGDSIVLNNTTYTYERVIAKSTGEAEIYLLSSPTGLCVFKFYYPNFKPKDDVLRLLKSLRHVDIINVLDYGYIGDRFFEIMEYADGGSLERHLPIRDPARMRTIVQEIVNAFEFCHTRGIVHKDIKPANLYCRNADGTDLVIGDFGISTALDEGVSRHLTSQSLTVGYAAPEMYGIGGKVYVGREVDYYALGITLIHLWQGVSPFAGLTIHAIASLTSSGAIRVPEDMPDELRTLVRGLITIDFSKRWGLDEVGRWLAGEDVPVFVAATQLKQPPFRFDVDMEARSAVELVKCLKARTDRGKKLLYSGKISAWVNLFDPALAARLDQTVETEYPRDQSAGLQKAIYLLDPEEPFESLKGEPCRLPAELAVALQEGSDLYESLLADPRHPFYLFLEAHEASKEADTFRAYYKTFSPKRALNAIILALLDALSVSINGEEVGTPEAVLRFRDQKTVAMQLKDRDSRLSVWMDTHADSAIKKKLEDWRSLEVCDETTLVFVSKDGDGVPRLEIDRDSFNFSGVKRKRKLSDSFVIRNAGGGSVTGTIRATASWLTLSQSAIDPMRKNQDISFTIDTAGMPFGASDKANIEISSNVGKLAVIVEVAIEYGGQAATRFRYVATFSAGLVGMLVGHASIKWANSFGLQDGALSAGATGILGAAVFAWTLASGRPPLLRPFWSPWKILVVGILAWVLLDNVSLQARGMASWGWLFMTVAYVAAPRILKMYQSGRQTAVAVLSSLGVVGLSAAMITVDTQLAAGQQGLLPQLGTRPTEDARPAAAVGDTWTLSLMGLGPLKVGTSLSNKEISPMAPVLRGTSATGLKIYTLNQGPPGLTIFARGAIVSAVKTRGNWATLSGVVVGDSVDRLQAAYPSQIQDLGIGATSERSYAFVPRDAEDASRRVVFLTERGVIAGMCAGLVPDVFEACTAKPPSTAHNSDSADATGSNGAEDRKLAVLASLPASAISALNSRRSNWTPAPINPQDIENCGSSLPTVPGTATGDFDGDGRVDHAAWIVTDGKLELLLFPTGGLPQVLEKSSGSSGTLLATIPKGQEIVFQGTPSIDLPHDGLSVIHCEQSQYVYAWNGSNWDQFWISD